MVLSHWNSMAYAESLSSSMNNRELSTNAEENSRYEADVTWSISHGILSLSKVLSLGCLRKWLQKSLLMQLFIKNMSFFKYCTSACCWEKKGNFYWHREKAAMATVPRTFQNPFISNLPVNMKCICTFCYSAFHFLQKKASLSHNLDTTCWWISAFHVPVRSYSSVMFWERNCLLVQLLFGLSWSLQRKWTEFCSYCWCWSFVCQQTI